MEVQTQYVGLRKEEDGTECSTGHDKDDLIQNPGKPDAGSWRYLSDSSACRELSVQNEGVAAKPFSTFEKPSSAPASGCVRMNRMGC